MSKVNVENVSKKTLDKIAKAQVKLDTLTSKRDDFVTQTNAKIAEMNVGIKEVEAEIASLREIERTEKLDAIGTIVSQSGVDVNTLLKAVANGDLYAIQEMIERNGKSAPAVSDTPKQETAETADTEDVAGESQY